MSDFIHYIVLTTAFTIAMVVDVSLLEPVTNQIPPSQRCITDTECEAICLTDEECAKLDWHWYFNR